MRWLIAAVALAQIVPGQAGARVIADVDAIVVYKSARSLVLLSRGQPVHTIRGIQLGPRPSGAKHFQGDGRTPEGHYIVDFGNPDSDYHLSLHISYPSGEDIAYARAQGRAPGGAIFIHGQPNDWNLAGPVPGDWTEGCIAVSNGDMETVWQSVGDGTPIDILP